MTQLKFVTSISTSGRDRNIIIIPKVLKKQSDKLLNRQVKVVVDDAI
jgi:hypothetical protein